MAAVKKVHFFFKKSPAEFSGYGPGCHFLNVILGPENALFQVLQWKRVFVPILTSERTMALR